MGPIWSCTTNCSGQQHPSSSFLYHTIITAVNLRKENFVQRTISGSMCSDPSKPFNLSKYWIKNSKNIVLRICFVSFSMGYSFILFYLARQQYLIGTFSSSHIAVHRSHTNTSIISVSIMICIDRYGNM